MFLNDGTWRNTSSPWKVTGVRRALESGHTPRACCSQKGAPHLPGVTRPGTLPGHLPTNRRARPETPTCCGDTTVLLPAQAHNPNLAAIAPTTTHAGRWPWLSREQPETFNLKTRSHDPLLKPFFFPAVQE